MILIDFSSAFHKCTHGLVSKLTKETKREFVDLKLFPKEHQMLMLSLMCDHINKFRQYSEEIVICLDDKTHKGNWRKQIYPMYKHSRQKFNQSFKSFDFADAYSNMNQFLDVLYNNQSKTLFKCIGVPGCEADDVIMVLAKHFAEQGRNVLILSPDKDFLQLHTNPNIKQYSWMTNKMIIPPEHMEDWLLEHVCVGDSGDCVPRIVDFKEFKPGVREFLLETGQLTEDEDAFDFSSKFFNYADFENFGGVFEKEKFGISTLKRKIQELGSLDAFLDLHPVHRKNYYRNRQLVLEEGIPSALKEQVIETFYNLPNSNSPATGLVEGLGLSGANLPDLISNKYISEQQLSDFLDW